MYGIVLLLVSVTCLSQVSAINYYYMDNYCNGTVDISYEDAIRLKLTSRGTYRSNMACSLLITTTSSFDDRFMLFFKNIDIESSSGCNRDWLEVHDGRNIYSPYVSGINGRQCGGYISSSVRRTSGPNLFLYFRSDSSWQNGGFDMVITQFHTGTCYGDEFSCSNGRCVSESLVCNGYNPCGDYSDCVDVITGGVIAGIIVGSFCFAITLVVVLIVCRRRHLRMRRQYQHQPVNGVAQVNYGAGYNQPVPQQYPAMPAPGYPTGQQYPQYPQPQ